MEAYTKKATEETVGLVQRKEKIATEDCFIFVSQFASKISSDAVTDIGAKLICLVKTNTQVFVRIPPRILKIIDQEVLN